METQPKSRLHIWNTRPKASPNPLDMSSLWDISKTLSRSRPTTPQERRNRAHWSPPAGTVVFLTLDGPWGFKRSPPGGTTVFLTSIGPDSSLPHLRWPMRLREVMETAALSPVDGRSPCIVLELGFRQRNSIKE
jgi:hypothetical protein